MANALRCDRCGKFYATPICVSDLRVNGYTHPYGDRWYDLCADCQKDLERFLKNEDVKGR